MKSSNEEIPPDVLDRIVPEEFSVPDLMGLAIVERGAPMTLEEIVERLADLGVVRSVPSLRKAWHALHCLRKNREGKLELIRDETQYSAWKHLGLKVYLHLRDLAWKSPRGSGPEKPAIDDATPVALDEVLCLPGSALPQGLSLRRRLALLVEACGGEVEVERAIRLFGEKGAPITEEDIRHSVGSSGPVSIDDMEEKLVLKPDESLRAARRILREVLWEIARAKEQERNSAEHSKEWKSREAAEREEIRRWYGQARKAVLRCVFGWQGFGAASVLDPDARTFQDFTSQRQVVERLESAEILFGIDPWADLERLEIKPGQRRLVDLSPPVKTVRLNRRGRTLRVTPELIIRSTLGISHPLGDPKKLNRDLTAGSLGKVFRRLQADLKALWRLYDHGCLQGGVRLEWGFLRERWGVGWNVGRHPDLYEVIEEAREKGCLLEAVLGRSAPGWEDPWSRAIRLRIVEYDQKSWSREFVAEYAASGERQTIPFEEIAAIRRYPEEAASSSPTGPSPAHEGDGGPGEFAWPDERDDQIS